MALFSNVIFQYLMETVSSSEASVGIYQAARYNIPEDSHFPDLSMLCLKRGCHTDLGLAYLAPQATCS
jgi:hypothetical protein